LIFGYARVSTQDQNLYLQLDALHKANVEDENLYTDKLSGKTLDRPRFNDLMKVLRKGDVLIVYKMDRISRSLKDLISIIEELKKRGIEFMSLHEQIDTTSSVGRLTFHIFGALAEFERSLISDRTKEGLQAARARGRVGGRPKHDPNKVRLALSMYKDGKYSIGDICAASGFGKTALYRYIKQEKAAVES